MKAKTRWTWIRWAPLLALTATLAACGPAVPPDPAATPAPAPAPAEPQATCDDAAIRLLDRSAGIHGAIVADTLHMGGAEAPVTCADPANLALLTRLSIPDDWTAQVQQSQSQYYLIVIRYPGGNRLYVVSRRSDGTSCVVDTNDQCIAQVTELPDGFDLGDLPDDVAPTIPAGRPAPEPPAATDTAPATAGNPQPRDGATGVAVETLLLSWSAAARAASYDVYWGREEHLTADAGLGTPIGTTFTATTIRRPGATAAERRLALGTTYYWRVDAKNDQGTTTGSVWSFTTADQAAPPPVAPGGGYTPPVVGPPPAEEPPPAAPVAAGNRQPRDGATGVTIHHPRLSWSAVPGANQYSLSWSVLENLDIIDPRAYRWYLSRFELSWAISGSGHYHGTLLDEGTTYYWRVDALHNADIIRRPVRCGNDCTITRGDVWSFTTKTYTKPHVSVLDRGFQEFSQVNGIHVQLGRTEESKEKHVWIEYATADGTATAGEDYESTSGLLKFGPSSSTQIETFSVYTLADRNEEGVETFLIKLRPYYRTGSPSLVEEVDCEKCTGTISIYEIRRTNGAAAVHADRD